MNGRNKQIFNDILREDSAKLLKYKYLETDFSVTHKVGAHGGFANGDHIGLVNLGSIAFFIKYRLTSSSGKEIKETDNAHIICLMYNILSSAKDNDDLSVGFHGSTEARERELTINKSTKGNFNVRIF